MIIYDILISFLLVYAKHNCTYEIIIYNKYNLLSDYVIGISAQKKLLELFRVHLSKLLQYCDYTDFINKIISFESFYGSLIGTATETMIPGFFIR